MYDRMTELAETGHCDLVICNALSLFLTEETKKNWLYREDRIKAAAGSCCNKLFKLALIAGIRSQKKSGMRMKFSARAIAHCLHSTYIPVSFIITDAEMFLR